MTHKSCSRCHQFKPLAEFTHDRSAKHGRHHRCKACERVRTKERLLDKSLNRSVQKWANKNPMAIKAHKLVARAIKRGELKRQPCRVCGAETRLHGHHADHSKALDVDWRCFRCHPEHHRIIRLYGIGQDVFQFIKEGAPHEW